MTVLDAQAVVALLLGEPAAEEVAALLTEPEKQASISAVNAAEVIDVLVRVIGRALEEVTEKLDWLAVGGLEVAVVDDGIGRLAGRLHARHYHRRDSPLSRADCVALATALRLGHPLATADGPLAAAAVLEGCEVIRLQDSQGRRPA